MSTVLSTYHLLLDEHPPEVAAWQHADTPTCWFVSITVQEARLSLSGTREQLTALLAQVDRQLTAATGQPTLPMGASAVWALLRAIRALTDLDAARQAPDGQALTDAQWQAEAGHRLAFLARTLRQLLDERSEPHLTLEAATARLQHRAGYAPSAPPSAAL